MKNETLRITLSLAAGAMLLASSNPAHACIHVVTFSKAQAVANVAQADRLLAAGHPTRAYLMARRARRRLEADDDVENRRVIARARRVTAVAIVRLGGHTPISRRAARRHLTRGREARSLRYALEHLRGLQAARPDDLSGRAMLAEALARFPEHRAEARAILVDLAQRDLMPSAHGYATLLRLLRHAADPDLFERALLRCEQTAGDDAIRVCPRESTNPS